MKMTKIMAVFVVLMLTVITVCVSTPDSNSEGLSETSGIAYYYPESNMVYRSAEPIPSETIWELKYYPFIITGTENIEEMDNEVREYLIGMRDVPESVPTEPGQSYYCYFYDLPYQIDVVEIRPGVFNTTLLPFNPGKYSITIESITVKGIEYKDSYKVRLITQSNGYTTSLSEITVGSKCDFNIPYFTTCWFEPTDRNYYAIVEYSVSSTASVKEFTHGDSGVANTLSAWCSGTVTMNAGEYQEISFSSTNAVFMIEKGSEYEQKFLEDIVHKNVRYSYYGGYYSDKNVYKVITSQFFVDKPLVISKNTEYSVYMLNMDNTKYCWMTGFDTTGTNIMGENVAMNKCNDVELSKIRFYAEANKTFEIGLKYDSSKYIATLVSYGTMNGYCAILESGKVYSINNKTGCTYTIEFKYIGTDSTDDIFLCNYEIQKGNLPNSDGLSIVFAIVTIALCALAFGILIYAGRKPKW